MLLGSSWIKWSPLVRSGQSLVHRRLQAAGHGEGSPRSVGKRSGFFWWFYMFLVFGSKISQDAFDVGQAGS